jgi:outer membrane murein-binding lipoprotein Lpp
MCVKAEAFECKHRGASSAAPCALKSKVKTMKPISILAASAAVTLAGCSSFPRPGDKRSQDHEAHHATGEAPPKVDAAKFDQQMKTMHAMHQKMMAAKTPAERSALMKEHANDVRHLLEA